MGGEGAADDARALSTLQACRTIPRPALVDARVRHNRASQGVLNLKAVWRDVAFNRACQPP